MFNREFEIVAGVEKSKALLLKNNKLGYFVRAMLVGAFVGLAIMLIFTIGGLLNSAGSPAKKNCYWIVICRSFKLSSVYGYSLLLNFKKK